MVSFILHHNVLDELQLWRSLERLLHGQPVGNYIVECNRSWY